MNAEILTESGTLLAQFTHVSDALVSFKSLKLSIPDAATIRVRNEAILSPDYFELARDRGFCWRVLAPQGFMFFLP